MEFLSEHKSIGIIFDKFYQKNHFRLFPISNKELGAYEAYISNTITPRYSSKYLENLQLSDTDCKVLLFAFVWKEEIGKPDGMGDISNLELLTNLSPGSREDNYIISNNALIRLYDQIEYISEKNKQMPPSIQKILKLSLSNCYFDKTPLLNGSICYNCASELRKEGYIISNSLIGNVDRKRKIKLSK